MLPELLQKAPPRSGVESLLSATKARVYQTARIVVALCFGPFALLVLIVAAQGAWGAFPMAGLGILAVSVLIGGPLLWYVTQDLRWARKLLTDGAVVEGTVVETALTRAGSKPSPWSTWWAPSPGGFDSVCRSPRPSWSSCRSAASPSCMPRRIPTLPASCWMASAW